MSLVDTIVDSSYTPVISLMGVAPAAHIITHVVKIQAALIGPILCSIAASLTSVRKRCGHNALHHLLQPRRVDVRGILFTALRFALGAFKIATRG